MTTTNEAPSTLPCNTATECAFIAFAREALILGNRHGVFQGRDRLDFTAAIRAADVELITVWALGVVEALLTASKAEITARCGRWATAAYINLLHLGRAARVIPHGVV